MNETVLFDDGIFRRVEYTLERGETLPLACSTKREYKGPGRIVKEFYPDGGVTDVIDDDTCHAGWRADFTPGNF